MTDHGLRNPQSPNTTRVIQQPSSKDEMPPPAQLLHNTTWTNPDRQALSRQYRSLGQIPGRHSHNGPTSLEDDFSPSDIGSTRGPMFNGTDNVPEDRSYDVPENMMPAASLSLKEPQIDDGELDRNFRTAPSRLGSRLSGISSSRITLPPSTPSIFNHHTPRRIGLSANVRTSRPPLPTSASSRSPPRKIGYYPPAPSNAPAASPYFSNRALPNSQVSQSPYVDSQSLPVAPPNHRSRSTINAPIHAPAASAPWKLPWLTAPFRQGQRESQSRQGSSAEQLHNGSGAYRQPGGHQHVHDQRPSLNGFSFATQPQIENANGGRSSRTPFASHGRRPARR